LIRIYNEIVQKEYFHRINLKNIETGNYIMKITGEKEVVRKCKVIKL